MPVLFQKIPDDHFNIDQDFIVKESRGLNIIIGIFVLFSIVGILSTMGIVWHAVALVVGSTMMSVAYFRNGFKNATVMIINKDGFYYYGQLITNWENFIDVEFIDDMPQSGTRKKIADRFGMMIRYYKDGAEGYYGRKICFTDTQDKSEEEIIAAVKFYHAKYLKAAP